MIWEVRLDRSPLHTYLTRLTHFTYLKFQTFYELDDLGGEIIRPHMACFITYLTYPIYLTCLTDITYLKLQTFYELDDLGGEIIRLLLTYIS
jgi:hypothetical protein